MNWKKFIVDHAGHAGQGLIVVLPLLMYPGWITAGLSGLMVGAIREIDQYRRNKKLNLKDRLLDVAFHGVGGELAYVMYLLGGHVLS